MRILFDVHYKNLLIHDSHKKDIRILFDVDLHNKASRIVDLHDLDFLIVDLRNKDSLVVDFYNPKSRMVDVHKYIYKYKN